MTHVSKSGETPVHARRRSVLDRSPWARGAIDRNTGVRVVRAVIAALLAVGVVAVPAFASVSVNGAQSYPTSARTDADPSGLVKQLHADLQSYLGNNRAAEHVSAAALSVSLPGHRASIDVSAGTTHFAGDRPVRSTSVWQIGSNTKAVTSVLLQQLEAEHRVSIHDTLGKWLPQYPQWRQVRIKRLLNTTSGIPSYDAQPQALEFLATHHYHYFSPRELVSYVVCHAPPTATATRTPTTSSPRGS